jgi:thymidylate synthase ThyX
MTITAQPYNPNQGWTIPNSIADIKEHKAFKDLLVRTEEVYDKLAAVSAGAAQYVLTNSHQRRLVVTLDAREMYHLSRMREDQSAQWDIRDIAGRMVEQARHVMPLALLLAGGKDDYNRMYTELFGHAPAVTELTLPKPRPTRPARKPAGKSARNGEAR